MCTSQKYKPQCKVEIDKEKEWREEIKMLEDKIEVIDDENQRCFYYKVQIQSKSFRSKARYDQCSKEEAVQKI